MAVDWSLRKPLSLGLDSQLRGRESTCLACTRLWVPTATAGKDPSWQDSIPVMECWDLGHVIFFYASRNQGKEMLAPKNMPQLLWVCITEQVREELVKKVAVESRPLPPEAGEWCSEEAGEWRSEARYCFCQLYWDRDIFSLPLYTYSVYFFCDFSRCFSL